MLVPLEAASVTHDAGKIAIPEDVINYTGRYAPEQRLAMQVHTTRGAELLRESHAPQTSINVALYHHQRYDGDSRGYPEIGLAGEDIPLEARMAAIVDVLDALLSRRSYKTEMNMAAALAEMRADVGHFDPELTRTFLGG